jgi:hypothetical protein
MARELKGGNRRLRNELAQIERQYEKVRLQQAQQGSQAKARNGTGSHFGKCVDVRHLIKPIRIPLHPDVAIEAREIDRSTAGNR